MAKKTSAAAARGPVFDDRIVRVQVSPKVLNDLDAITKVLHRTLKELGCQACCSGHDIRFEIQRNFVVDEQLNVRPG